MSLIPRVVEKDVSTELVSMASMVFSLPRLQRNCEAFVVYPGMGETWRLEQVIRAWQSPERVCTKHLLIAGTEWHKEATAIRPPIIENLAKVPYNLRQTANVHAQEHARHTKDQAEWVVTKVQELGISSLALYVSPYHLLRAYLTLLKTFINMNVDRIPMIPVPIEISPAIIIPETGTDAWCLVQGEMMRIKTYQEKGDVATLEELKAYLYWLWKMEPIYCDAF